MRSLQAHSLLLGLCLILIGCGYSTDSAKPASSSVSPPTEGAVPPCCVVEPSRAALLSGGKNVKPADAADEN